MTIWYKTAKENGEGIDDEQVAVGPYEKSFHEDQWDHYVGDMYLEDVETVIEEGMKPCGQCYPVLNSYYETYIALQLKK
jgi:hypothetical protein